MILIFFFAVIISTTLMIMVFHKVEKLQSDDYGEDSIFAKDTSRPILTDSSTSKTIRRLLIASFK